MKKETNLIYKVILQKHARHELKALIGTPHFKKVQKALVAMKEDPFYGDVSRLTEHKEADFRRRIGDYRILFDIDLTQRIVSITHIWHRGKDYKK